MRTGNKESIGIMLEILLFVIAAGCFIYFFTILSYAGPTASLVFMWLILGIAFTGLGLFLELDKRYKLLQHVPGFVLVIIAIVLCVGIILFFVLFGCVISGMNKKPLKKVDYVVVLGAQIKGTNVSRSLGFRLDGAIEYYKENNDTTIVVSGGRGPDEIATEASVMRQYLLERGVPDEKIIVEDNSTTTKENLEFSKEIILNHCKSEKLPGVAVCSNNFHIFRALSLAKALDYESPEGLATGSDEILLFNYMIRDSLAIFKEFLLGNI